MSFASLLQSTKALQACFRTCCKAGGMMLFLYILGSQPVAAQLLVVDRYGTASENDPSLSSSIPITSSFASKTGASSFTLSEQETLGSASIYVQNFVTGGNLHAFDGELTYYIFADNPSPLDHPDTTPLLVGTTTAYTTEQLTNLSISNLDKLTFDFDTPITLDPGSYWFAISATPGTDGTAEEELLWNVYATSPSDFFYSAPPLVDNTWTTGISFVSQGGVPAFMLYAAQEVPEPTSLALGLITVILISVEWMRRRTLSSYKGQTGTVP